MGLPVSPCLESVCDRRSLPSLRKAMGDNRLPQMRHLVPARRLVRGSGSSELGSIKTAGGKYSTTRAFSAALAERNRRHLAPSRSGHARAVA